MITISFLRNLSSALLPVPAPFADVPVTPCPTKPAILLHCPKENFGSGKLSLLGDPSPHTHTHPYFYVFVPILLIPGSSSPDSLSTRTPHILQGQISNHFSQRPLGNLQTSPESFLLQITLTRMLACLYMLSFIMHIQITTELLVVPCKN